MKKARREEALFFIFSRAVFRPAPQLTEDLEEANGTMERLAGCHGTF